jgi:charged multivesicular body protein 2B
MKSYPTEELKKQNAELRRAQRDVDRSQRDVEKQEKVLEAEIKKAAKAGNKSLCTIYAKQLVQLRKQKSRIATAGSHISGVSSQTKVIQSNQKIASVVASTTKAMGVVNRQMNAGQIMKTMQDFEKENAVMGMKEEVMDDALASALDHSEDEAEEDAVVNQVLDEIGIEIKGKLAAAPSANKASLTSGKDRVTDSELEEQLAKLKL